MTGLELIVLFGGACWLDAKIKALEANTPEGRRKAREERARMAAIEAERARQAIEQERMAQAMANARRRLPPPLPSKNTGPSPAMIILGAWLAFAFWLIVSSWQ